MIEPAVEGGLRLARAAQHGDLLADLGPRSGSKTSEVHIPANLPPGPLQGLLPLKVIQAGSMRPGLADAVRGEGFAGAVTRWREWLETPLPALATFEERRQGDRRQRPAALSGGLA